MLKRINIVLFTTVITAFAFASHNHNDPTEKTDLSECTKCKGTTFSFDGNLYLMVKLLDENENMIEVNTDMKPGEMTYIFDEPGTYYLVMFRKDGEWDRKKLMFPQ